MKNSFISGIFMNLALMKMKFVWLNCILFTDEADSLSKEETNFVRLFLCHQIGIRSVRQFFNRNISTLDKFLTQNKTVLTARNGFPIEQQAKLFPGEFYLIAMSINIVLWVLTWLADISGKGLNLLISCQIMLKLTTQCGIHELFWFSTNMEVHFDRKGGNLYLRLWAMSDAI
jgi:hypothetical protein